MDEQSFAEALGEFVLWFLQVCLDQVKFMASLFEIGQSGTEAKDLISSARRSNRRRSGLWRRALIRGEFRSAADIARITGLPDRTARRVLSDLIDAGLSSETPKTAGIAPLSDGGFDVLFSPAVPGKLRPSLAACLTAPCPAAGCSPSSVAERPSPEEKVGKPVEIEIHQTGVVNSVSAWLTIRPPTMA